MKISARTLLIVAGTLFLSVSPLTLLHAQSKPGWTENEASALMKAKMDKKLVLLDFTGSDWCGWCKKMDKEVFSAPEFQAYAKDNLVLVELDYPRQKLLAPATIQQNATLQKQYGVEGFPTLIVLDSNGKTLKTFGGYQAGGPEAFVAQLKALKPASGS